MQYKFTQHKGTMMYKLPADPYVYIAAPFFNEAQLERLEAVKSALNTIKIKYFSPKDESLYEPGKTTPLEILNLNVNALRSCDLLVCITDDRDPGTFFEAGWCFASTIPIVYIWFDGKKGQKFNLMLGASGSVVRDTETLMKVVETAAIQGFIEDETYGEAIDYE